MAMDEKEISTPLTLIIELNNQFYPLFSYHNFNALNNFTILFHILNVIFLFFTNKHRDSC